MKTSLLNSKYIIFDCCHTDAHVPFNSELIKEISKLGNVNLFTWNKSYDHLVNSSISLQPKQYLTLKSKNAVLVRFVFLFNTILNAIYLKSQFKKNKTKVVLIGYEIISFAVCSIFFPKGMFVIHHMQVDELSSRIKKFFFSIFKNRIKHVVMTDYIKEYLVESINVPGSMVEILAHPLYDFNLKLAESDIRTFISLNYSTDESYVKKIIELEVNHKYFSQYGCKLIIKSKLYNHSSDGLLVFNEFLENEVYYRLYANCTSIISLLNDSFEYRMSGTLIDALSAGKPIISLKSVCANHYRKYFGNSIMIYDNFDELIEGLVNFCPTTNVSPYPKEVIDDYKTSYIKSIQKIFG